MPDIKGYIKKDTEHTGYIRLITENKGYIKLSLESVGLISNIGVILTVPPGFMPNDVPGLKVWLDAADTGTFTHVSNVVSQWDDKSGEGNHVSQLTESKKPLINSVTIGAKNTASFDGIDDDLKRATFTGGALSQPTTFFMVLKPDGGASTVIYIDGGSLSTRQVIFQNGDKYALNSGISNTSTVVATTGSTILRAKFDNPDSELYQDDIQIIDNASIGSNTLNGVVLGGIFSEDSVFSNIDVGEVLIYDSALAAADINAIESYLTTKWFASKTPDELTGLKLWLDAADATTITHVLDVVSQWDDKSGEGNHISQSTESKKPLTNNAGMGGKNTISFDGIDDNIRRASFTGGSITQPNTIIIVLKTNNIAVGNRQYFNGGLSGTAQIIFEDAAVYKMNAGSTAASSTSLTLEPTILRCVFDDTTSNMFKDETQIITNGNANTFSLNGVNLGSNVLGTNNFANIDVAEVVVYDRILTGDEVLSIEKYLNEKWFGETLPGEVSDMIAWFDADDATTITEVTDKVSQWDDKSGEGNHLTQTVESAKPTTGLVTIGGKNTISFDNSFPNRMQTATFTGGEISQPSTYFIVWITDNGNNVQHLDGLDVNKRHLMIVSSFATAMHAGTSISTGDPAAEVAELYRMEFNTTNSNFYIDGVLQASGDVGNHVLRGIKLGSSFVNSQGANIDVAEIILYNKILTPAEISGIENYLKAKWSL